MNFENEKLNNDNVDENHEPTQNSVESGDEEIISEEDENTPKLISKLRKKIEALEAEKQTNLNGWQRERADFVNFKKRSDEERKEFIKFANEALIGEIIPVLESFDMAFSNGKVWESLPAEWRKGVEYIHTQLLNTLKSRGLEELNPPKGEKFNPNIHIAESLTPIFDKKEDSVIISTVKKGYRLNGKTIIPPRVVVGEYKEDNSHSASNTENPQIK